MAVCEHCGQTIRKPRAKKEVMSRFTDEDMYLANLLHQRVGQNFPFLEGKDPGVKEFEEMNKLSRLNGRNYETIRFIIEWCQQDPFWQKNIRSVAKLRKQFDTLMVQAAGEVKERQNKVVAI